MTSERPVPKFIPAAPEADSRELNGTGEKADEDQLGISDEEVQDLENDAEGG